MIEDATPAAPENSTRRPRPRPRLTAQDIRDRRRRLVTWALSVTLGVLLVNAMVGESGYITLLQLRREAATVRAAVAGLRIENQQLQRQGRRLQTDPTAIEESARRELGFVRPGETVIVLRDAAAAAPAASTR